VPFVAERSSVVYWALTGALLFAGFYVSFYGELPPHLLLAGAAMVGVGMLAFGGRKIWAMVVGIPVAFSVAFLLNIIVGR
jgi:hypothetical protein